MGILLLAVVTLHGWISWPVTLPLIPPDETGYLANAAALAGFRFDGASSYPFGYSLVIAPAFLLPGNPVTIYRLVQTINLALCLLTVLGLFQLQRILVPNTRPLLVWLSVLLAAFYPAAVIYSSLALSENAMAPVFVACVLCVLLVERKGGVWWIFWAVGLGFLCLVHPRALPVAGAGWAVGTLLAWRRKDWGMFAAFCAVTVLVAFLPKAVLEPWLLERLTTEGFFPGLHYPAGSAGLAVLASPEKIGNMFARFGGQLFYLFAATLGLAWIPGFAAVRGVRRSVQLRRWPDDPLLAVCVFLTLSLLGTMGLSALLFEGIGAGRLDHWMYGRYSDALAMPLVAIGFLLVGTRSYLLAAALAGIFALSLHFVMGVSMAPININIVSLWQSYLLPGQSPVLWWLVSASLGLLIVLLPRDGRVGGYLIFFLFCGFLSREKWILPHAGALSGLTRIPDHIRKNYAGDFLVAFETDWGSVSGVGSPSGENKTPDQFLKKMLDPHPDTSWMRSYWIFRMYGFLLFERGFHRVTLENWRERDGKLLLSTRRDLDRRDPGLRLLEASRDQPFPVFLWADKADARGERPVMKPEAVVKMGAHSTDRIADFILGDGWHSDEAEGLWSAESAQLLIPVGEAFREEKCGLETVFLAFRATESTPKTVHVEVEGVRVASWTFTSGEMQKKVIPLSSQAMAATPFDVRVEIKVGGAESPASSGGNPLDTRTLGIWLQELRLIPGLP